VGKYELIVEPERQPDPEGLAAGEELVSDGQLGIQAFEGFEVVCNEEARRQRNVGQADAAEHLLCRRQFQIIFRIARERVVGEPNADVDTAEAARVCGREVSLVDRHRRAVATSIRIYVPEEREREAPIASFHVRLQYEAAR